VEPWGPWVLHPCQTLVITCQRRYMYLYIIRFPLSAYHDHYVTQAYTLHRGRGPSIAHIINSASCYEDLVLGVAQLLAP
jgi:hypothetical protein